ncbi:FHY3/FAR1 family protein [Dioscorea alata]|uniref:FHY3/FAR1 family protein n=1 Tax=Dioscorea alata TaxID=55571 RepID=A0ACB7WC87_DIOAL|nr:FHY3/FAR1 family protein [Dioscorea alata]
MAELEIGSSIFEIVNKEKEKIVHFEDSICEAIIPKAGMTLDSEEEVYNFYVEYARHEGFGITKRTTKSGDDGRLKYYTLACVRGGKRRISSSQNSFNPRLSTKTECPAKINVIVGNDGRYTISRVHLEHNHALSPQKSRFQKCNKKIDAHVKRRLELNDRAGISLSKNFHFLAVESGGYENLAYTERDCRNYIAKARQIRLGVGDADALGAYFSRMQWRNSNFFYLVDMDDEGRLRNVFWADALSRAAYESFGDVVSFDTTYLTNKYDMPFAPFVGVNHHGQTILFGCGLLSKEDTETYIWLFKTWLECMSGKAPNAIITDQCMAIQGAIRTVFPNSHHRLCLWHIMKKVPEKLGGLTHYKAIKKILKSIVYEAIDVQEFEDIWLKMIKDYNIEKNEWLNFLYINRQRSAPIYVKGVFWAGMSTTQRSESINAFFDGYVGPTTSLKQFVEQYDNALKSKIEKENKADFASFNSNFSLLTDCYFEKQLHEAYTNEIFKLFQNELRGMLFCNLRLINSNGPVHVFQVTDIFKGKEGRSRRQVVFNVYYNEADFDIKCSCLLFEFRGIFCRHICKLLIERNVKEIPSHYVLPRWRKDIKRRHTYVMNYYEDTQTNEQNVRYTKLYSHFAKLAEIGVASTGKYLFLMKCMDEAMEKLMDNGCEQEQPIHSYEVHEQEQPMSSTSKFLTPLKVRSKGRPPSKRKKSKVEELITRNKKKVFIFRSFYFSFIFVRKLVLIISEISSKGEYSNP